MHIKIMLEQETAKAKLLYWQTVERIYAETIRNGKPDNVQGGWEERMLESSIVLASSCFPS